MNKMNYFATLTQTRPGNDVAAAILAMGPRKAERGHGQVK